MLGNYLQQMTSADDIFRCTFVGTLRVNVLRPCSPTHNTIDGHRCRGICNECLVQEHRQKTNSPIKPCLVLIQALDQFLEALVNATMSNNLDYTHNSLTQSYHSL